MKNKAIKILIFLVGLVAVSNVAVWYEYYAQIDEGELTVAFLDIGQGDAIFIETPSGNQVLVDGGPNSKVLSELGKVMPWYDKTLDVVIATHPDQDHIGGLLNVLKRFEVSYFIEPGVPSKTLTNSALHELITSNGIETIIARRGLQVILEEGIVLTVLYPDTDVADLETNEASIVARLVYGDFEVLLTGDSPIKVEKKLVDDRLGSVESVPSQPDFNISSDILKIGHHGSKTSSSESFVAMVDPKFSVISSGKNNKYGHPASEVLDILKKFSTDILRTDEVGTIVVKSDGKSFWVE